VIDDPQWNAVAVTPGWYRRLETLTNEQEVWDRGVDDPYK
jgi:hypothetical protein